MLIALCQTIDLSLLFPMIWVTTLFKIWKTCALSGNYRPVFSLLWQQVLPAVKHWTVLWLASVFVVFKHTHTPKKQNKKASKFKIRCQSTSIHKFCFISWQIKEVIASWKCTNFQSLIVDMWCHRGCQYLLVLLTLCNSNQLILFKSTPNQGCKILSQDCVLVLPPSLLHLTSWYTYFMW